jgi:hypothetical protein
MCSLPSNRESAPMTQASIGADFHQSLDIHGNRLAQISFHHPVPLDDASDSHRFFLCQVLHFSTEIDGGFLTDFGCTALADTENIGQANLNPFV